MRCWTDIILINKANICLYNNAKTGKLYRKLSNKSQLYSYFMSTQQQPNLLLIREALEASWDEKTSYLAVKRKGNPALGQCYPTSRVVQHFFPKTEIIKGEIWNGKEIEIHFWNGLVTDKSLYHIDLSWQQFPPYSSVKKFRILDRKSLNDSLATLKRCEILLNRVLKYINTHQNINKDLLNSQKEALLQLEGQY